MLSKLLLLTALTTAVSTAAYPTEVFRGYGCDQILHNRYYTTCYNYAHKGPKYTFYKLKGSLVDKLNIVPRPSFRQDHRIPSEYRAKDSDYTRNGRGLDRGHMAPDADKALRSVYLLSNVVPQNSYINRGEWSKAEELERILARTNKVVYVTNGVVYDDGAMTPTMRGISVPSGFWKYITNRKGLNLCLYYPNHRTPEGDSSPYREHMVSCTTINNGNIPGMNVE